MKPYPRLLITTLALAVAACGTSEEPEGVSSDAPPASAVVLAGGDVTLTDALASLDAEIEAVLAGDLDRILRAEALTDRLMQASRQTDWLASGYHVDARLRQMQTIADRLVAMLRRGAPVRQAEPDLQVLQRAARDLREELGRDTAREKPPSLDTLLARVERGGGLDRLPRVAPPPRTAPPDSAEEADAETGTTRGPLGVPVRDTTGGGGR